MSTPESASPERGLRLLLTSLGFLLVLAGQVALYLAPADQANGTNIGLVLSLVGVSIVLVIRVYGPPHGATHLAARLSLSTTNALIMVAVLLALMAAGCEIIFGQLGRTNYLPVLVVWVLSVLTYVGAFVADRPDRTRMREWLSVHRRELLLIGLVPCWLPVCVSTRWAVFRE